MHSVVLLVDTDPVMRLCLLLLKHVIDRERRRGREDGGLVSLGQGDPVVGEEVRL